MPKVLYLFSDWQGLVDQKTIQETLAYLATPEGQAALLAAAIKQCQDALD